MNDSCPSCLARDIAPAESRTRGDRTVDGYRCPRCGHAWATVRDLTAYSELHARRAQRRTRKEAA
ncbi:hypothetical protein AB0G60_02990 [Streptomyces angustmyceticus]|uniref:C2H2-type domain-containing protein n=1 Tax=Streptomyces angustmyceticus TaxID=285578 RepID=A0A5J4L8P3_9ACTN|nr:hypothetical protein [Streptomyces angustmyceticus]UAL65627.1 hypothetical protein K7396_02955 [Streptomyces angustmyceticus]GES27850.1 hypothetical protein San01_03370 [Streptomyces angustmyceticus]